LTQADDVVVFLNGGPALGETTPEALQSRAEVTRLARVAAAAGAAVVVGNHSPIIKPVQLLDETPYFEATGDLVSDVRRWSALPSTIPQVLLSGGRTRSVSVDPIGIVNQRPVPVVGTLADAVARRLTSIPATAFGLGVGATNWPPLGVTESVDQEGAAGEIASLPAGWVLDQGQPGVRAGRDLLWGTGSMEDLDTDREANGSTMWALGKYVTTSLEAGCHGAQGLRLRRGPLSAKDVVISPQYRQPVHEGEVLSLTANVRLASAGASLEVRWYRSFDPTKRSSGAESVTIEPHELRGDCAPVRLELTVPEGMVAAQPYVRLSPVHDINLAAELRVDDVRLIRWAGEASGGRAFDTYETAADGTVGLSHLGVH
jgi:poly-gamma-glutamate synthesis protein (capsule biosynthesis protein)